ncbi:MAG: response regulator receiver sensor hybrid histidine kinase [Myxococcales bacterium]|nr:response regulator receiver sensor hybrid histidine kinase [Myxococcales bacterium]
MANRGPRLNSVSKIDDEDAAIERELDPSRASILLVDDVPANLLALEAVLEPLGHRLIKARSGTEALKHVMDEEFALILMDVQMPDMDGFQTVALIKQRPKSVRVPIIFITAIAKEAQHISTGYQYGAVDYITKPFDADILRAKISVLVSLHLQAERIVRQQALLLKRRHELEQQQMKRALAESHNLMKDQFLAAISHELRTPLNVIVGWTDLLVAGGLDAEKTRRAIETIQRSANVQKKLIDDLLDVSRMLVGKLKLEPEQTRVATVIQAAVDSLQPEARAKGVQLRSGILEECGEVTADLDPARMEQVFGNLLSNAVKFTPAGGSVEVALSRCSGVADVEVRDTGIGIVSAELPFVFDRFWQSAHPNPQRTQGLGLGLAIVRQLVELHGGTVEAHSAGPGSGSTFTVKLPLSARS